jgi:hypothetical protein
MRSRDKLAKRPFRELMRTHVNCGNDGHSRQDIAFADVSSCNSTLDLVRRRQEHINRISLHNL